MIVVTLYVIHFAHMWNITNVMLFLIFLGIGNNLTINVNIENIRTVIKKYTNLSGKSTQYLIITPNMYKMNKSGV